jgi:hypothetical protein
LLLRRSSNLDTTERSSDPPSTAVFFRILLLYPKQRVDALVGFPPVHARGFRGCPHPAVLTRRRGRVLRWRRACRDHHDISCHRPNCPALPPLSVQAAMETR